jgi:hypothetical protein
MASEHPPSIAFQAPNTTWIERRGGQGMPVIGIERAIQPGLAGRGSGGRLALIAHGRCHFDHATVDQGAVEAALALRG